MAAGQAKNVRGNNLAIICAAKNHLDYVSFKSCQPQPAYSTYAEEEVLKNVIDNYRWNKIRTQLSNMVNVAKAFATSNFQQDLWKSFFNHHGISPQLFASTLKQWLAMTDFKRNTLMFKGPTNSGKSLIVECITKPFIPSFITCVNKNQSEFVFMPALTSNMVVLEELFLTIDTVNDFKRLLEGGNMHVHMKYCSPQILNRRPVIATSQYNTIGHGYLPTADERALDNRCFTFKFVEGFKTDTKLTPDSFWAFIDSYWNEA